MLVLVAFATGHGSTRGVAERIASRLREHGIDADVRRVSAVDDLTGYDAVVLGSAIHGGKWLPEAVRFVRDGADALSERPVWLFSVSTLGDESSAFRPGMAGRLRSLRKEPPEMAGIRARIHPRDHHDFAGVVARDLWPPASRLVFKAMGGRYGDHRDWAAIDAWADRVAAALAVEVR